MKRAWIFFTLSLLLLGGPSLLAGSPGSCLDDGPSLMVAEDELPWNIVDAVLKKCAEQTAYPYSQLVEWYNTGMLTVEEGGSSYVVTIYDEDGILDIILIDHL